MAPQLCKPRTGHSHVTRNPALHAMCSCAVHVCGQVALAAHSRGSVGSNTHALRMWPAQVARVYGPDLVHTPCVWSCKAVPLFNDSRKTPTGCESIGQPLFHSLLGGGSSRSDDRVCLLRVRGQMVVSRHPQTGNSGRCRIMASKPSTVADLHGRVCCASSEGLSDGSTAWLLQTLPVGSPVHRSTRRMSSCDRRSEAAGQR